MDWFEKAFATTLMVGFGCLGVLTGLLVLRIAIGVAGALLGSTIGTLALAWILWKIYDHHKKNKEED